MKSYFALIAVGLDAAATRFLSKIEKTAAAVVVGVGLLVGSTAGVLGQYDCDPQINDVCLHKTGGWATSGHATMWIDFENLPDTKSGQTYEIVWHGQKKIRVGNRLELTYDDVSEYGYLGDVRELGYESFWWDAYSPWGGFGCTIYEGHWDYQNRDDRGHATWVRDTWVGMVHFYKYQDAAYVSLDSSLFPDFSLGQYYCSVDWDRPLVAKLHGYTEGYWERSSGSWRYHGDPGSPRFHYRSNCSVLVGPPPRTPRNTRPR